MSLTSRSPDSFLLFLKLPFSSSAKPGCRDLACVERFWRNMTNGLDFPPSHPQTLNCGVQKRGGRGSRPLVRIMTSPKPGPLGPGNIGSDCVSDATIRGTRSELRPQAILTTSAWSSLSKSETKLEAPKTGYTALIRGPRFGVRLNL
ncbi:uncharacterized protein BDZ83DRAFT_388600 [Colletotrichum acutatum]|uniref:Uncharacterized protein n=1 Tax=Glomerella acutata TaxID=27357 RepID=A0AAD8UL16_GLOAC|nr:uncharacterized protein BDZ83DRAFT_388600 [Colletotrichum acutatum]KAK1723488.1 hypothetical protein BDZ83DRAFT_388600 [Colletotrichum acutatum]